MNINTKYRWVVFRGYQSNNVTIKDSIQPV
jgi:hypothetical protein